MKVATLEDYAEVLEMAVTFFEASPYKSLGDKEVVATLVESILSGMPNEKIIILNPSKGFIAGASTPFLFGNHKLATEIAWWIKPEERGNGEGLKLLEAFEYWAKNIAGCKLISMASLDKSVEKYYKKNKYRLYERAYMKVL